ncbi:MAG: hypothetical protein LBT45_00770 [Rickettsiales bacterium]|jgi:hypothetical protein|nr:hypothetical protein [Rickettsiales bacterium]
MKFSTAFFAVLFAAKSLCAADVLPGGNLTSFSNQQGAVNNNQYNQMINPERAAGGGGGATADFGNCNALILRCATPKCGNGGCTDMGVATPIVAGCVADSSECKKHGDALIQAIAAQIVASNTKKANEAAAQAAQQQAAAAQAQSAQQMQQMQQQMQQMQQQMTAQQESSAQQMQQALAQQQQAALAQQAELAKQQAAAPAASVQTAIDKGVSADAIAREQIVGQVMSSLDGVDAGLKSLKQIVKDVLDYAKCDYNATSCAGPRRVAAFRKKAQAFFEPYDGVLDSLENSLYTAMAAGIDVSDIYMMLNNTCNQWGKYLCTYKNDSPFVYCEGGQYKDPSGEDPINRGNKIYVDSDKCKTYEWAKDANKKTPGEDGYKNIVKKTVNPKCTFVEMYRNDQRDEIQQNYILAASEDGTNIRMACMSDGLLQSGIFARRSRKKSSNMDIDALEIIINQDEPKSNASLDTARNYCAVDINDVDDLRTKISSRKYGAILCKYDDNGKPAEICSKCDLDEEDACYANQLYGMCSTHAYNVGKTNNNEVKDVKSQMDEIIALKSTVIAQQLKKQSDYLTSMVKQIKTQMQKSVMTAKAEAAGAPSGSSSSSTSSDTVAGQIDCRNKSRADTISCIRNNMPGLQSMSSTDFSKAIRGIKQALMGMGKEAELADGADGECESPAQKDRGDCLAKINGKLQFLQDKEDEKNRASRPQY